MQTCDTLYDGEISLAYNTNEKTVSSDYLLSSYKDSPGHPLKCTFEGTLKELVSYCKSKVKKLFYQQLSIRVNELENKKQFKCIWVGPSLKEEKEIILYPNKNGTVATLLEEAKKQVELSENGSGKLRILEINCNKLLPGPRDEVPLDNLNASGTKLYRIEEIPNDELNLAEDEMLVPVAHFHKDVFSTFGIPFFFKIKHVSNPTTDDLDSTDRIGQMIVYR